MARKAIEREAFKSSVVVASNECGKVAYPSRKDARRVRKRTPGDRLNAYRCARCGLFHIGHLPRAVRRGVVSARDWYGREVA